MKKGFTLVELIATLIVLSIVALIVVPNIYDSIVEYREQLYETQLTAIETSTKNWVADHIDDENFPKNNDETIFVSLKTLEENGYIDDDLKNPKNSTTFNDIVFTVVTCKVIDKDDYNAENYKYTYRVIDTTEKYLQYIAELWKKDNSIDLSKVTTSEVLIKELSKDDLISYIDPNYYEANTKSIKDIATSELISNYSAKIYASKKGEKYIYRYEGITK